MARQSLHARHFLVLVIICSLSFVLLLSTTEARTLTVQNIDHHGIVKPSSSLQEETAHYIAEVLGLLGMKTSSEGPSPGANH